MGLHSPWLYSLYQERELSSSASFALVLCACHRTVLTMAVLTIPGARRVTARPGRRRDAPT